MRRVLIAVAVALAVWPAVASAWGPPRSGGFGANVLVGGAGADFLRGAEGDDRISGRGGDDLLTGDTGPDTIRGGDGKDTLIGGSGIDELSGGSGDDIVSGGFGADTIDGGPGGDALEGNQDADTIAGGPGDDLIHGGSGIDHIDGGDGADRIFADSGGDVIDGGAGDDTIVVDGSSAAQVRCGAGNDTVFVTVPENVSDDYAGAGTAGSRAADCETVELTDAVQDPNHGVTYLAQDAGGARAGTALDDVLLGGPGADTLRGLAGNDVLWGLRQAGLTSTLPDVLDAGPGDDTVYGGPGRQRIIGGAGDDFLESGVGDGTIDGGTGDDTIRLRGAGAVAVRAGAGRDTIYARGAVRGTIACGSGKDLVYADANDVVARDCERVKGTANRRGASPRPAAARHARAVARAAAPTYADLVAATPGLTHWWRMSQHEPEVVDPNTGVGHYVAGLIDRITHTQGPDEYFPVDGPTDDGDSAFDSEHRDFPLEVRVDDTNLHGQFTFEGWIRARVGGTAMSIVDASYQHIGTALVLEADGSLRAEVSVPDDPRRADVRTPPLRLGTSWHHVALTQSEDRIAIYVDGALAADAPAVPVPVSSPGGWLIGYQFGDYADWNGGLDEIALYDRPLDAATIHAHARVGDTAIAPVARTKVPFASVQPSSFVVQLVTASAGSIFSCGLDGAPLVTCPPDYEAGPLADGPHVLRVVATDRFGVIQTTPTVLPFTVDNSLPQTIALVRLSSDGDRRAVVAMGSDRPGTFQCSTAEYAGPESLQSTSYADGSFGRCANGSTVPRGVTLRVRAVSAAGLKDPSPVQIYVPPVGMGFQGPETGLSTFAGARAELQIAGRPPFASPPYECRYDGGAWTACRFAFRLPIVRAGRHTLQARQRLAGSNTIVTTGELGVTVSASDRATTIAGLQTTLVLDRKSLARRSPVVRLALDRRAALTVTVVRGRKLLLTVRAAGAVGPNTVAIPARALRRLPTGRYGLVVTARGSSGPAAVQRLPFALVRSLG